MKLFTFLLLILLSLTSSAQEPKVPENAYGIKNPTGQDAKHCSNCQTILQTMPRDVKFGFMVREGVLFFVMTDVRWFDKLFTKSSDGIAVDIISKEQYSCKLKKPSAANSYIYKGYLMKPLFLKEMKNNTLHTETGEVFINMGALPKHLEGQELEFNLLIINNKYLCRYNTFFDLPGEKWSILDMGLYMDTIKQETLSGKTGERTVVFHKNMQFEIPFEKNKAEFSESDIKPLYDSLRLNDYNIKSISIRAYASVEGSLERNIELQEKRAESLVKVLQSFQIDVIEKDIHASENWVEFLEDIAATKHSALKTLSKAEIKARLENKQLSAELEPVLKKHRKAILRLELEKKTRFEDNDTTQIRLAFEKAVSEKNIQEAMEIQQIIFSKIRNHKIPESFVGSLEIPVTYEFGCLLSNYAVFHYEQNESEIHQAITDFSDLLKLMPDNRNIKYNIVALKIKALAFGERMTDPEQLKKEIISLEKAGIDKRLIRRMMINYHIILSEYHILRKEYAEKDKAVKFIQTNYSALPLNDKDLLNLAKYFVGYSKYEWAESLLAKHAAKVDVNEDLLFYYINTTIVKPKVTSSTQYRTIMLNAININKERFCKLFDTFGKGGITFQLLENDYLRKTYCENCQ